MLAYLTLFFSAFLSATLFPFGSELILLGLLELSYPVLSVILVATAGNTLGALTSYGLGYFAQSYRTDQRVSPRAESLYHRYGVYTLLLSWMPIIGDMFPLLAGWFKAPLWLVSFLICFAKLGRYLVLTYSFLAITQ